MSLRARVGLRAFAVVILGVGLAAGGGYYFAQRELHQEVDQFLERRARAVSEVVQRPADLALQRERAGRPFIGRIALADFDAHVQILNTDGRPVFAISNVQLPVGAEDRRLANEGGESVRRTVRLDGRRYRILTTALGGNGAVQVARDLGEIDRALNDLLRRTIPLGVILAAAAAAMAWLLARRLQQQLVADAGHELRTPLTSMRTNIELLQRTDSLERPEQRRILADVNAELRELSELVRELVELAGEPGATDEPSTTIDLADLAADAAARAGRRTGRDITTEATSGGLIAGQRGSLGRAVDNLVGNAVKFSPDGTPIRIVTGGGRLEVHDSGPGIPTEDRPLVFERFFRSASARAQPGSGLGLAIVKQIVERHGGRVWAGTSPTGGTAVGFEIPSIEQRGP